MENTTWSVWAEMLQRWGLRGFAAWLLEAASPLNVVGAQLVYVGQPFLEVFIPGSHMKALAQMLEEPRQTQAFIRYLQEEN